MLEYRHVRSICFSILFYSDILFSFSEYLIEVVSLFLCKSLSKATPIEQPFLKCLGNNFLIEIRYFNLGVVKSLKIASKGFTLLLNY